MNRKQTRDAYEAVEALNWSRLKLLNQSPLHYHYALTQRAPEQTPAMARGVAMHAAVFEPEKFMDEYVAYRIGARRGKEWEAFSAAHASKAILTADDYDACLSLRNAVRSHPEIAPRMKKGRAEVIQTWKIDGRDCKGRLDWLRPGMIDDLKTTADLGRWVNQASSLAAHSAAAWYVDGYKASTGDDAEFHWLVAEAEPPHECAVFKATPEALEAGRRHYQALLSLLRGCEATGRWPGRFHGVQDFVPAPWAHGMIPTNDDDATLTIGGVEVRL